MQKMLKNSAILRGGLWAVLLALAACASKDDSAASKKVFRYNQLTPITSLDPAFARNQAIMWACQHLYDCLVDIDDSLRVVPALARAWSVSPDGLHYTFYLRDSVFFHDNPCFPNGKGRLMRASDVVFSFNRLLDTVLNPPGSWIFKDRVRPQQPFEALNDSTFVLHLSRPFGPMLNILTMQYCSIVPEEAIAYYKKDFRKNPVGTGPFVFKKWLENQGLFLVKNTHYWDFDANGQRLPYLDGVRTYFMPDRKTAYLEMMRGKLDFMSGIESSVVNELLTPDGRLQPKHVGRLQLVRTPFLNSEYLGINMDFSNRKTDPLAQKKIRQALNYGFDRALMLKTLRNSMGTPAGAGFAPQGLPSFNEKIAGYTFNKAKAAQLLAEAGFPNGQGLPPIKLLTNKDYLDLGTFISRQWEDLGIKTQIDVMESATLREMMTKGTAAFFRGSWIADYPDAESFFTFFYGKNPAPPNYTQFKNARFDALYEAALSETNTAKRYALYDDMERILIEEAPVIFLFYDQSSRFALSSVKGLSTNAMNLLPLKKVQK